MSKLAYYTNVVLHKLAHKYPSDNPDSILASLISDRFVNNKNGDRICKLIEEINVIISQLEPLKTTYNANGKKAIIFLLKGHFYVHNIHNYIIAHILKAIGYEVSLVTCQGNVERCGNSQQSFELRNPPFACNVCKKITSAFDATHFKTVSLNQYRYSNESEFVNAIVTNNESINELSYSRAELLKLSRYYLLRYFNGDFRKISVDNQETILHLKSATRLMLRYTRLIDHLKPDVMVFFNGTFYPEHLFIAEAEKRKVSYYCTERGMKKNSLFLSYNLPATTYDGGALWEHVKETIGNKEIEEAKAYLNNRMQGPEDPTGIKRNVAVGDISKYESLASKPYVVFFAPVTHDTVSMGKNNEIGDVFDNMVSLCKAAINNKKHLVIRCHPDEKSVSNPSHYTVKEFLTDQHLLDKEYVICLGPEETWHPYTLAKYANASVIYNGTLGIELPALGYPVFNLAMSHYRKKGFTMDIEALSVIDTIYNYPKQTISEESKQLAWRYLYYYINIANLSIDHMLDEQTPFIFTIAQQNKSEMRRLQLEAICKRVIFYESVSVAQKTI